MEEEPNLDMVSTVESDFQPEDETFEQNGDCKSDDEEMEKEEYFKPDERFPPGAGPRSIRPMRHPGPMQYRGGPRTNFPPGFRPRMPMPGAQQMPYGRPGMGPNRNGPPFDAYGPPMGMPRGHPRHPPHFAPRYPNTLDDHKDDMDESMHPYGEMNMPGNDYDGPPNSNPYHGMQPPMRPRGPPPYMMGPHGGPHPGGQPHGPPGGPGFNTPPGQPFNGPPYGGHNTNASGPFSSPGPAYSGPNTGHPFGGPPGPPFTGPPSNQGVPVAPGGPNFGGPPPGPGNNVPPNMHEYGTPAPTYNQPPSSNFTGPPFHGPGGPGFPGAARPPFGPGGPPSVPPSGPPGVPPPGSNTGSIAPPSALTPPSSTASQPTVASGTPGAPSSESAGQPPFGSPCPPYNMPSAQTTGTSTPVSTTPSMCPPPSGPSGHPTIPAGFVFPGGAPPENVPFGLPPGFPGSPAMSRPLMPQPLGPGAPTVPLHMMPPPMSGMPMMPGTMPPFRPPMSFMPPTMPGGTMPSTPQQGLTRKTVDDIWVENLTADGKSYYYNMRTRETRWDRPEGVSVVRQGEVEGSKSSNPAALSQTVLGNTLQKPPDVAVWTEYHNPEGKPYYHNSKTGETTWEKPKILKEWEDQQHISSNTSVSVPAPGVPTLLTNTTQSTVQIPEIKQTKSSVADSSVDQKTTVEPKPSIGENGHEKPESTDKDRAVVKEDTTKTPKDTSRPVSSTAVAGTPWCVVWTGDERAFFFNPSQRLSVWERPEELRGRSDVDRLLEKQPSNNSVKPDPETASGNATLDEDETAAKKPRLEEPSESQYNTESRKTESPTEPDVEMEKPLNEKIPVGLEAAREAEERAARERAVQPLEVRVRRFREMLVEMQVSAFSTWEKELHKIVFDQRYLLLASKERKQTFEAYVKERAEEERREKKNKLKERKEKFNELLEESELTSKSSFSDFAGKFAKDERFKGIEKSRDRESLFQDYLSELRKREKDEKHREKEKVKSDFISLLNETKGLSRHSHWSDIKRKLDSDPRYKAVESSSRREDWFRDHVRKLDENPPTREDSDSRKEREKKERQEASIREREKEVKEALSSSMREREKEREQQIHAEQEEHFRTLLSEFIRDPETTWKEAKKILRKDSRWELVSDTLQRSERDELFKEHLSGLSKRSRDSKPSSEVDAKEKRYVTADLDERSEDGSDKKLRSSSKDSGRR